MILYGRCSFTDDQKVAVVTHQNSTSSLPTAAQAHQGQVLNDIVLNTVHVRLKHTAAPQLCVPQTLSAISKFKWRLALAVLIQRLCSFIGSHGWISHKTEFRF